MALERPRLSSLASAGEGTIREAMVEGGLRLPVTGRRARRRRAYSSTWTRCHSGVRQRCPGTEDPHQPDRKELDGDAGHHPDLQPEPNPREAMLIRIRCLTRPYILSCSIRADFVPRASPRARKFNRRASSEVWFFVWHSHTTRTRHRLRRRARMTLASSTTFVRNFAFQNATRLLGVDALGQFLCRCQKHP